MASPAGFRKPLLPRLLLIVLALAGIWGGTRSDAQELAAADPVRAVLRLLLAAGTAPWLELEGQGFRASSLLPCFYQRREFVPAWSAGGALLPGVSELLAALAAAADDGLRAEDYRQPELARLAEAARSRPEARQLADLDLLLSDAFLTFAAHLRSGKVNPAAIYPDCALGRDATAGRLTRGRRNLEVPPCRVPAAHPWGRGARPELF